MYMRFINVYVYFWQNTHEQCLIFTSEAGKFVTCVMTKGTVSVSKRGYVDENDSHSWCPDGFRAKQARC